MLKVFALQIYIPFRILYPKRAIISNLGNRLPVACTVPENFSMVGPTVISVCPGGWGGGGQRYIFGIFIM